MTKLSQQILDLINMNGHMNAEEVFLLAKKKKINVSLASTYRILGKLAEDGLIKRITIKNKVDVFDKTIKDHGHLVCDKCGKIMDFEILHFKNILDKQTNSDIISYELCAHYICEDCRKKEK